MCFSILFAGVVTAFAQIEVPACSAAMNPVNYGMLLTVPEESRALIESYRSAWRTFCRQKPGGQITLADLYSKAERIRIAFDGIIEKAENDLRAIQDEEAKRKRTDEMHDALMKTYPTFVPAFDGSLWEYSYFHASTKGFKVYASRGSREDRLYFNAGIPLSDNAREVAWIERTWEYGGCTLFGEFDWSGELRRIGRVKKEVKSDAYVNRIAVYESSLFYSLEEPGQEICTCGRKDTVLKDYRNISKVVDKQSPLSSHLSKIRPVISGIESGNVRVGSEREKHCSGG
jgi:hypothetical protein